MPNSTYSPRFFFDGPSYQIAIGIETQSGEIFFIRNGSQALYKEDFTSDEEWDVKVKELVTKLLLTNASSFSNLHSAAKKSGVNSKYAMLLTSIVKGE